MQNYIRPVECGERGIALVGVLWIVALLSVFAASMIGLMRSDHFAAHYAIEESQAEALADAGLYLTLHALCDVKTAKGIPVDGQRRTVLVGQDKVVVSVQDEGGKIDLNYASKELLTSLFRSAGLPGGESVGLAEKIAEMREAAQQPDDVPFHAVEEIRKLPGITDAIFQEIRSSLTVYSQQASVAEELAPPEVLRALRAKAGAVVQGLRAGRTERSGMVSQDGLEGRAFTLKVQAVRGESIFVRYAVVRLTGDIRQPFWILDWAVTGPEEMDVEH